MSLQTYEEYIKDMPLVDQIKFYYDVDVINPYTRESNFIGDPWDVVAEVANNPNWINEFKKEFEEYLREREYIK